MRVTVINTFFDTMAHMELKEAMKIVRELGGIMKLQEDDRHLLYARKEYKKDGEIVIWLYDMHFKTDEDFIEVTGRATNPSIFYVKHSLD